MLGASSGQNTEGICQHLELIFHSLQASLDLQRVVQHLDAAGVGIVPHGEGTLYAAHVCPGLKRKEVRKQIKYEELKVRREIKTQGCHFASRCFDSVGNVPAAVLESLSGMIATRTTCFAEQHLTCWPNKTAASCLGKQDYIRNSWLLTAMVDLQKSLWPQGKAGCSLTLSLRNLSSPFFFSFSAFQSESVLVFVRIGTKIPEFLLSIQKTLRNEVNRLVRLVLIGLHRRSPRVELPGLWFVRQRVLG